MRDNQQSIEFEKILGEQERNRWYYRDTILEMVKEVKTGFVSSVRKQGGERIRTLY